MQELEINIQKHLNTLLHEFKKCKSKKKYIELLNIYNVIQDIIANTNLDVKHSKEFDYELKKYSIEKYDRLYELKFLDNFDMMYEYNLEFSNIYKYLNIGTINNIEYQAEVDISDTIKMVRDFLKHYNKDIYNYFNKQVLDKGLLVISDKIDDGRTYLSNYILPPYSLMNPQLSIKDYIVIIHETIHSYIRNRLRYINFEQLNTMLVNNLEEVFPIYTELCAIKYAKENNMLPELDLYEKAMYSSLYTYLEKYYYNLVNTEIVDYVKNERYAYGYLLAYQYYNKEDVNAQDKVLRLSLDCPFHDKKYMLNNYGINQFELLNTAKIFK